MSSIVDNHAANALRILIANNPTGITEEVRNHWTRFLIASLVRRPQSVQEAMDGFRQVLKGNLSDFRVGESVRVVEAGRRPTDFI